MTRTLKTIEIKLDHGPINLAIIALDDVLDLAVNLQQTGQAWHSHVLPPGTKCRHNPYPDNYAIVIEDDTRSQAYIAPSDGFPQVDKQLVRMLHGDDILEVVENSAAMREKIAACQLLQKLRKLHDEGRDWHHHMCFPKCIFNPNPGRWSIIIESGMAGRDYFYESWNDEPLAILREIELLFFGRLELSVDKV